MRMSVERFQSAMNQRMNGPQFLKNRDSITGQELFKPKIMHNKNRPKSARDQMDPQYIGEYLYKHGLMMNKKKELL